MILRMTLHEMREQLTAYCKYKLLSSRMSVRDVVLYHNGVRLPIP